MKHVVGVADMKISNESDDQIITHALGSCLGITVYDPVAKVGGLLHVMLPTGTIDEEKAKRNPYMFVDAGVPKLFLGSYDLGAKKERMVVKVAGGACVHCPDGEDYFQIGKRNFVMLRKVLWKNGVLLESSDVGGGESRTMTLEMSTGEVTVRSNGSIKTL